MKIRNGFVSNSSSSSYVIAIKVTNEACPHCGRKDPDFLDVIDRAEGYDSDRSHVNAKGIENVIEYWKTDKASWFDEDGCKEILKKLEKYKYDVTDWTVADIQICYHDDTLKTIFNNMRSSGNLKVIYDAGD